MNEDLTNTFWVPDEERSWWTLAKGGVWKRSEVGDETPTQRAGYAFTARECRSHPLLLSSADPSIVPQIVRMELELVGLAGGSDPDSHFAIRLLGKRGERELAHVSVIPGELSSEVKNVQWASFAPSPLLYTYPSDYVTLWQEQGCYVAVFTNGAQLVHFHTFWNGPICEEMIWELGAIVVELQSRGVLDHPKGISVWAKPADQKLPEAATEAIERTLGLPVEFAEKPSPEPANASGINPVPRQIEKERELAARWRKWMRYGLYGVAFYLLVLLVGFWDLSRLKRKARTVQDRIEMLAPAADAVLDAQDRWYALVPAIERDQYPIEVFHRIAAILPEKGIRLTHFEVRDTQIILRGEAASIPTAIRFKADLENSFDLRDYDWVLPQPETKGEIATFVAYGNQTSYTSEL
ncbi:MAG: hypothetical protein AAF585_24305 [Verrucomicrobiota bacterium]